MTRARVAHAAHSRYPEADALRERIRAAGYSVRDTRDGPLVAPRTPEEEFGGISRSAMCRIWLATPDVCEFSVNLLAHNSWADLRRCVESIARNRYGRELEIVIVDNGSTDDTLAELQTLARDGCAIPAARRFHCACCLQITIWALRPGATRPCAPAGAAILCY